MSHITTVTHRDSRGSGGAPASPDKPPASRRGLARHSLVLRAWRGDAGEESAMTGTSVDEDRIAAERLLAEQLMDLPDISCVTGWGSSSFLPPPR